MVEGCERQLQYTKAQILRDALNISRNNVDAHKLANPEPVTLPTSRYVPHSVSIDDRGVGDHSVLSNEARGQTNETETIRRQEFLFQRLNIEYAVITQQSIDS